MIPGPCITALSQSFQPVTEQLSLKAALPLAKSLATALNRSYDTGSNAVGDVCFYIWLYYNGTWFYIRIIMAPVCEMNQIVNNKLIVLRLQETH